MAEYTLLDYAIYLAILLAILWFFSRYVFRRIEIDKGFLLSMAPYIIFGVTLRMLADVGVYERNPLWNITPGVYTTTIVISLTGIAIGLFLKKRLEVEYWIFPLVIGILAASYTTYNLALRIEHVERILYPLILAIPITGAIYLLSAFFHATKVFQRADNVAIIFAHLLDGSATFIGIDYYHFTEEHLLPDYLISLTGTAFVMIPLKIAVILPALYLLERWYRGEKGNLHKTTQQYQILKLVFFILGVGPGLRDAILPATIG
jgi:uncharacterized membrane protein